MNASLPPEDDRREDREEQENRAREEGGQQRAPRVGLGAMLGLLLVVGFLGLLLLPAIQDRRVPAQRSAQDELERRQQEIEQAAREASDADRLADQR